MAQTNSRILWGSTYENVLAFEHPALLDNRRAWRRPAPGSRRASNAVVTTAWIAGRQYMLAGRARYFNRTLWSGGPGIQEFLDWAGEGNTFRFMPDTRYPLFYVDGCTLDEPFDDPAPELEQSDGSQSLDIVLRNPTFDFNLLLRGLMLEYGPGSSLTDPAGFYTFTRGSSAYQQLSDETWASAANDVLRNREYDNGTRGLLLEAAATNVLTASEDLGNAAWVKNNVSVVVDQTGSPFAASNLDKITCSANNAPHYIVQTPATASGPVSASCVLRPGSHAYLWVELWNATDGTVAAAFMNMTTGTLTSSQGTVRFRRCASASDYGTSYSITIAGTQSVANSAFIIALTNAGGSSTWSAAGTETVFAGAAMVCAAPWTGTYHAGSRGGDSLYRTFSFKPQALWAYLDFTDRGTVVPSRPNASAGWLTLGTGGGKSQVFVVQEVSGGNQMISAYVRNSGTGVDSISRLFTVADLGGVVPGDRLKVLVTVNASGQVQIRVSKNGGATVVGTLGAVNPLTTAFPNPEAVIGAYLTNIGLSVFHKVKVGAGTHITTIAQAEAA